MRSRSAFSLIEVMISIGLGSVIVYTAVAAVRTAAQTVSVANRLSVENSLLRSGIVAAHDEVDFWTGYDDPSQPLGARGLAQTGPSGGRPFAPFTTVWPKAGAADPEDERGFVPDPLQWAAFEPRAWYHGSLTEMNYCTLMYGRYSLFMDASASPAYRDGNIPVYGEDRVDPNNYDPYPGSGPTLPYDAWPTDYSGAPGPAHRWYCNQLKDLMKAVGFYGFSEYLPANSIYAIADQDQGSANQDNMPFFWILPGSGQFTNGEISGRMPACKYRNTSMATFCMVDPITATAGWPAPPVGAAVDLDNDNRTSFQIGFGGTADDMTRFMWRTDAHRPLIPGGLQPSTWPSATVSVGHFVKNARPISLCYVRITSPQTGNRLALSFTSWGTTLRGARQQRARSGGWAAWDDRMPLVTPNDKTLDDY